MRKQWDTQARRSALVYGCLASAWIGISDVVVQWMSNSTYLQAGLSLVNGVVFVLVSCVWLFFFLRLMLRNEIQVREDLESREWELLELKTIAEHSDVFFYKQDAQFHFTYATRNSVKLFGVEPGELKGGWAAIATSNEKNQQTAQAGARVFETGEKRPPYLMEVRKKDGTVIMVEADEVPMKDASGKVVAIVGSARDVTIRERAEQELQQSRIKFRQLSETMSEVFWMANLDLSEVYYVNPAFQNVWGRSCDSLYRDPKTWIEAIHPEDREMFIKAFHVGRGLKEISVEHRVLHLDGSARWVHTRAFPVGDQAGESSQLVGFSTDVTDRKIAEEALRESGDRYQTVFDAANDSILLLEQALRESGDRYRTVFDSTNDGILLMHDRQIIDCNQRAMKLFGATRKEMIGIRPEDLAPERQPDGQFSLEKGLKLAQCAQAGEPQFFQWQHVRKDGTNFFADVSLRRFTLGTKTLLLAIVRDISERIRAEEALRDSEEKLRGLYNSMNEGLALHEMVYDAAGVSVDYRMLDVNPAFELITGISKDKVLGQLGSDVYGETPPPHLAVFASVAETGQSATLESYAPLMKRYFTISVFSPRKGQFATVFADISKRKEAENQICLLNRAYALISHVNEAIVRISERQTLFQEACRIAVEDSGFSMAWIGLVNNAKGGFDPLAYIDKAAKEGFPNESHTCGIGLADQAVRELRVVILQDMLNETTIFSGREELLARGLRSGIALPLRVGGEIVAVFCVFASEPGFFSTIVAESLIEVSSDLSFALELFERNIQRDAEQHQLRLQHSALEAAANAIAIANPNGGIEWVNGAFTRLTGYQPEDVIGDRPGCPSGGLYDSATHKELWKTVQSGSVWQGELSSQRKDGSVYCEEVTLTPVRAASGEVLHVIAIKQDITERRKLEQQFLRAQRMQGIGMLAGGIAHDLNNVLTPLLMALPLLRSNLAYEDRDHILNTLEQSVKRGANIIQQVLTFARGVEGQRLSLELKHLIREITRIAEETFPRDIHITSNLPKNLWPFEGDPTQIHQVLLNLAVNARDAMPDGGRLTFSAVNIELTNRLQFMDFEIPPGRYVTMSVGDTGMGISQEVMERMFDPFFTTKPTGKGTGLGLSTVLGIVKSHGGLVEVKSSVGLGAAFTIYLPVAPGAVKSREADERPAPMRGSGETVLIVDDEPSILMLTRSALEASGYRVVTAKDGHDATLQLIQNPQVQVVVTDIMMPRMDGLALTRCLKESHPQLPVVAATGLLNPQGEMGRDAKLKELGVKYFLRKPFHAEELLTTLNKVLKTAEKD